MEFVEVMRQWKRRCEHCDAKEDVRCYVHGYTWKDYTNFKSVEEDIMKWAAEHPEPVYPTWAEWFRKNGVVPSEQKIFHTWLLDQIPADIAEKLGVKPKESV